MWRVLQTCVWLSVLHLLLLMERSASQVSVLTRNMLSFCSIPGLEIIFGIAPVNLSSQTYFWRDRTKFWPEKYLLQHSVRVCVSVVSNLSPFWRDRTKFLPEKYLLQHSVRVCVSVVSNLSPFYFSSLLPIMSNLYLKRLKFWIKFYYKKLKHYLKQRFLSFMAFSIYEVIWVAFLSHS